MLQGLVAAEGRHFGLFWAVRYLKQVTRTAPLVRSHRPGPCFTLCPASHPTHLRLHTYQAIDKQIPSRIFPAHPHPHRPHLTPSTKEVHSLVDSHVCCRALQGLSGSGGIESQSSGRRRHDIPLDSFPGPLINSALVPELGASAVCTQVVPQTTQWQTVLELLDNYAPTPCLLVSQVMS